MMTFLKIKWHADRQWHERLLNTDEGIFKKKKMGGKIRGVKKMNQDSVHLFKV